MTAAVRIELDDEQIEAIAERIAAKLRSPKPRAAKDALRFA